MMWLPALLAAGGAGIAILAWPRSASASAAFLDGSSHGGHGGTLRVRLTTYHPLDAKTAGAKREEGPPVDRKGNALHYLEDVLAGSAPWVSASGDPAAWRPYGQLFYLDVFPGVEFRVVDDGEHFMGDTKEYREPGREPLDIAVRSASTKIPTDAVATFVRGNTLDKPGKDVDVSKFKGQNVMLTGYHVLGGGAPMSVRTAYTDADHEALARAIASSCPSGAIDEKQAVGWVCRNRAAKIGKTIAGAIAPEGYGPRDGAGRDFVSTAADPDDVSDMVAKAVLALPEEEDPTGGAFDFWNPSQQDQIKALADIQSLLLGADQDQVDVLGAEAIREVLATCGLHVVGRVGDLELLA